MNSPQVEPSAPADRAAKLRGLPAMIGAQVSLHAGTTGMRAIGPLVLLQADGPAWQVGVLLACFGLGPMLIAWQIGHLVERYGYRRPIKLALVLGVLAVLCAFLATLAGDSRTLGLCLAGALSGAAANTGMITLQRTAARMATDPAALRSQFAWVGVAPSASNVAGPLLAGVLLDLAGASVAMIAMIVFPLTAWLMVRIVRAPALPPGNYVRRPGALGALLSNPKVRRMMVVDLLIFAAWDVHAVLVPILGHERGLSATVIGLLFALFAGGVVIVRAAIPWLSHRLTESKVILASLITTAAIFALYPLGESAWYMGACALGLGCTIGVAQPMIMSTMHQTVDETQRGSMLGLRSMWINFQAVTLPVAFAAAATAVGWAALFWGGAVCLALGGRAVPRTPTPESTSASDTPPSV